MADISLRAYAELVENKLGNEAYSEAIAHCRHVLEIYPRNIEFYALWARALAIKEEFQDALDLFQRVLSVDPNHFIAHIGMNDCYRESDAVDQAIWHLERAFEQVPSNLDIQDEIKRLYQERDGVAPRKIQLTGGALARLYAKGKLYPQAISELTKALSKDPERLDLQILLAEVLWDNHQYVEAGQIAGQVLKRLPNSLGANAILFKLWQRAGKPDEARLFLNRVREIDPYLAYELEAGTTAPAEVATINQLAYSAEAHAAQIGAADWVSQLGRLEKSDSVTGPLPSEQPGAPAADVPDWLKNIGTGSLAGAPPPPAAPSGSPVGPDDQPAWLDDILGGEPVTPPTGAAPVSPAPAEDVPAWMKDLGGEMAPPHVPPVPAAGEVPPPGGGETPDWLHDVLAEETPTGVTAPPVSAQPGGPDAPDWLQDVLGTGEETPVASAPAVPGEDQAPDWLKDLAQETPPPPAADTVPVPAGPPGREAPDWLKDILTDEKPVQPAMTPASQEVSADWLDDILAAGAAGPMAGRPPTRDLAGAQPATPLSLDEMGELETWDGPLPASVVEAIAARQEALDLPPMDEDWLKQDTGLAAPEAEKEEEPAQEVVPDWLAGALPVEPEAKAETAPEGEVEEAIPDWLASAPRIESAAPAAEVQGEKAVPDWLSGAALPADELEQAEVVAEKAEAIPDWLQADSGIAVEDAREQQDADKGKDEIPDWLAADTDSSSAVESESPAGGVEQEREPEGAAVSEHEPVAGPAISEAEPAQAGAIAPTHEEGQTVTPPTDDNEIPDFLLDGNLDDSDAALAWLEQLAAKYDPTFEGGAAAGAQAEEKPAAEPEPAVAEKKEEELPDWLAAEPAPVAEKEPEAPAPTPEPAAAMAADDGLPDWLKPETPGAADEELEWLREPAEKEPAMQAEASEEIPDWLKPSEEPEPAAVAAPVAATASADDALGWLDQQIAGQGVSKDAVVSEALTADHPPVKAELPIPPPDAVAEPASSDDLPDWLRGVDTEAEAAKAMDIDQKALEEAMAEETPEVKAEEDELAWLTDTLEKEEAVAKIEGLEDLLGEEEKKEPAPAAVAEKAEEEELPDWLKGAEEPTPAPAARVEAVPEAPPTPQPVMETPPLAAAAAPEPAKAEEEEKIPDWLAAPAQTAADVGLDSFLKAVAPAEAEPPSAPAPAAAAPPPAAPPAPPPTPAPAPVGTAVTPAAGVPAPPSIGDADAHLQRARSAIQSGEWDTAFTAYEELVANRKMLHEAIADLSNYVKSQPVVKPRVYRIIGDALMAQGKLEDALDMYRQALDNF